MDRARPISGTLPPAAAPGSRRIDEALRSLQRRLAAGAARLPADASVEDVHQARVTARRLRSHLRTFEPLLDARRARRYRAKLREYARALAEVREADVREALLVPLARRDARMTPAGFHRLSVQLEGARHAARDALRRRMSDPRWAALCRALDPQAASGPLLVRRDAGVEEVLRLVRRAWCRARKRLGHGRRDVEALHELRLALKHCRYAVEAVADVEPEAAERLLRRLRAAQDRIGEHRDLVLARHWLEANERSLGATLVRRLDERVDGRLETLHGQALGRSERVLPAYRRWRRASRRVRRAGP